MWEVLEHAAARFEVSWEKQGSFLWIRSPRNFYAWMDGIDLLDERPSPPPKFPSPEDPEWKELIIPKR